jgi:membrane peptidoglycan carboxypeptidase
MPSKFSAGILTVHSLLALCCVVFIFTVMHVHGIWKALPDISDPSALLARQSLVIADREGEELYRFYDEEDRTVIPISAMPPYLADAVIAIEDKRFLTRRCIDVRAIIRAGIANMTDYKSQGASTITQQLARRALLYPEKTLERKLKEIMLACQLEWKYSKNDILELYLNWISFGHGIAGVQQASKRYFGVDAANLSIGQSAILASLPQRPTYLNPYGPHRTTLPSPALAQALLHGEVDDIEQIENSDIIPGLLSGRVRVGDRMQGLAGRADIVLRLMHEQGRISDEQWVQAKQELAAMNFATDTRARIKAPHFVLTIRDELLKLLDLPIGSTVHTTIDPVLQQAGEAILLEALPNLQKQYAANNAALLAVDLRTNTVLAYVGNADFFDDVHAGQIDMVRVPRQTGSAFKPFVYASLLQQPGYSTQSYIYDKPLASDIYRPFQSGYYGRMTIKTALARSRNIPAIRAFYFAGGEDVVLQMASRFGIDTPKAYKDAVTRRNPRFLYGWSLALGAAESSLLEMVQGYSVLARNGVFTPITAVTTITDGQVPLFAPSVSSSQVLQPEIAQQLTQALQDENAREPLWRDDMHLPFAKAAVKTGTSNRCLERDRFDSCSKILPNNSWTVGYAGNLLVGVWVGNASGAPLNEEGISLLTATPLWKKFMIAAHTISPR